MNGFPVQGMAQDKGNLLPGAEVGEPVPAEQALDGDDESITEGGNGLEEGVGIGGEVLS